jgi:YVTN family beta-propeller protein
MKAKVVLSLVVFLVGTLILAGVAAAQTDVVYVPNRDSDTISVVNAHTYAVIDTIALEYQSRPLALVSSPDGRRVYVALSDKDAVGVVDTWTLEVVENIPVGDQPIALAITPDGSRLFVSNFTPPPPNALPISGTVSVIDTASSSVIATLPVGVFPVGVAVKPDGSSVYVCSEFLLSTGPQLFDSGGLFEFDVDTLVQLDFVQTPGVRPVDVTFSANGQQAFVAAFFLPIPPPPAPADPTLSLPDKYLVINTNQNTIGTEVLDVGLGSAEVVIGGQGGRFAYISNFGSEDVAGDSFDISVIRTANGNVEPRIPVGSDPAGMAVSPDGDFVYVSNAESDELSVIDTSINAVIATVPVGDFPVTPWAFTVPEKPPEPPDPGESTPFAAFDVRLYINFKNRGDDFHLQGYFKLGETSDGIDLLQDDVFFDIGTYSAVIPAGSFTKRGKRLYKFREKVDGRQLEIHIWQGWGDTYFILAKGKKLDLTGTENPVTVNLQIGNDLGTDIVQARIKGSGGWHHH